MSLEWMAIRGSGLIAYALLSGAVIWGLLVSTKVLGPQRAKQLMGFHEALSIGALLATVVHMVALAKDEFIEFSLADIVVPGAASWRPAAVALGVVAFYALLLITGSFYIKQWIGQTVWRTLHYGALGAFLAAMLHGVMAGSDAGEPLVFAMYVTTGVLVCFLVIVRIVQSATPARRRPPRPVTPEGDGQPSPEREGSTPPATAGVA